jgi:tryptophan-rich sensory protein
MIIWQILYLTGLIIYAGFIMWQRKPLTRLEGGLFVFGLIALLCSALGFVGIFYKW